MKCSIKDCEKNVIARGLCSSHYWRWRKYGDPLVTTRPFTKNIKCSVKNCKNNSISIELGPNFDLALCRNHYRGYKLYGDPTARKIKISGSGYVSPSGYIQIQINGRKTLQHILVAEKKLGRKLKKKEVVHHINGDRSNNRPENLQVLPSLREHNILHRRQEALEACGHADWRRCYICKKYDSPENLFIRDMERSAGVWHRECRNKSRRKQNG